MKSLTVGQVRRSIQRFKDYADDFARSDMNTYDDRSGMFFDFCKTDPVMAIIHTQLIGNPNVGFQQWHRDAEAKMTGWAGSAPLKFPTKPEDRMSLMYQLLLAIEESRINFHDFCIKFIVSEDNSYDSYISRLSEAVILPLVRELEYKLDEILESLAGDKASAVSPSIFQIINTTGPVVQQVAIGNGNAQSVSQTIGNPDIARLLADLSTELTHLNLTDMQKAESRDILIAATEELASSAPKKAVICTLLKALPIAGNVASIVQAIIALLA